MPRRLSAREIERALVRVGFEIRRQRGSHLRLRGYLRGRTRYVSLTANQKEIPSGTLYAICHQLGITAEELEYLVDTGRID